MFPWGTSAYFSLHDSDPFTTSKIIAQLGSDVLAIKRVIRVRWPTVTTNISFFLPSNLHLASENRPKVIFDDFDLSKCLFQLNPNLIS